MIRNDVTPNTDVILVVVCTFGFVQIHEEPGRNFHYLFVLKSGNCVCRLATHLVGSSDVEPHLRLKLLVVERGVEEHPEGFILKNSRAIRGDRLSVDLRMVKNYWTAVPSVRMVTKFLREG